KLSAVVFVRGCPWKCVYCQNPWMQDRRPQEGDTDWARVIDLLKRRQGLLDGVVFSGGEPCVDPALPAAVSEVKALGMCVGLHTSGAYPEHLQSVIDNVDWVGLDVKATMHPDHFNRVVQTPKALEHFIESFEIILKAGVRYEARTTAHPDYLTPEQILELAYWLKARGCTNYALQIFRKAPGIDLGLDNVVADYPGQAVLDELSGLFPTFLLRRG
ncbi:MAG: anaerobic ribonucleoside-triphosphate reductase activating protein, partial [Sutterellaceae bacterium]|nr:anaerobic ribonucleoside-triphosphate reductase activating protein [Sutterellaceae bacterium]